MAAQVVLALWHAVKRKVKGQERTSANDTRCHQSTGLYDVDPTLEKAVIDSQVVYCPLCAGFLQPVDWIKQTSN